MIRALKLIFVQQALAEYVTSDEYAAVFISSDLSFESITYTNSSLTYPLRLTDGLYGIGAWSERVELETIFIGYEDDKTFNFASWIAMSGSVGCNDVRLRVGPDLHSEHDWLSNRIFSYSGLPSRMSSKQTCGA